jgi:hypothetical protein
LHRQEWDGRSRRGGVSIGFKQFVDFADKKDQIAQERQKIVDAQQAQQRATRTAAEKKRFGDEMTRINGQGKASDSNSWKNH